MNIGGYDEFVFNESDGNSYLSLLLQKEKTIKTHFREGEKGINDDGYFELLKHNIKKKIVVGKIMVQIKTIDKDYENHNIKHNTQYKYKYSCDTKFFNAVSANLFLEPAILILIDIQDKRVFYLNLTYDYVESLAINELGEKTVYFNDKDEIMDLKIFYSKMLNEYNARKERLNEGRTNEVELPSKIIASLQKAVDMINAYLNKLLPVLFEYPESRIWKVGIGYSLIKNNLGISLYEVNEGINDLLLKEINPLDTNTYITRIYMFRDLHLPETYIQDLMEDIVFRFFEKIKYNLSLYSTSVLAEIIFMFLDKMASYCNQFSKNGFPSVFYKDIVEIEEALLFWSALRKVNIEILKELNAKQGATYSIDPFQRFCIGEMRTTVIEKYNRLIDEKIRIKDDDSIFIIYRGKFEFKLVEESLKECKNREIKILNRPWRHTDFLNSSDDLKGVSGLARLETGYKLEDYYYNIRKLLSSFVHEYNMFNSKAFGDSDLFENNYLYTFILNEKKPSLSYVCYISTSDKFEINIISDDDVEIKNLKHKIHGGFFGVIRPNRPIMYNQISQLVYKKIHELIDKRYMEFEGLIF